MRVVVVGDVGRPDFYHTGDEAMTEAAVDQLRRRHVDEVVLVASSPALAGGFYGCPAVPRLRFSRKWSRQRCDRELASLDAVLAGRLPPSDGQAAAIEAMTRADSLLVAGGGNLRSEHRYMIYERVALVRVARHLATPVFITSQTVGPMLEPADEPLVREIAASARCFGAREPSTAALVRSLVDEPGLVQLTMDDSVLLEPRPEDFAHLESLALPRRFVVASFTYHAGSTGMSRPEYRSYLAEAMDAVADLLNADVLLVPHCGAFAPEIVTFDRANDAAVVEETLSGRVRALPLLTARQAIALTSRAALSISTRYHATIFGTTQGVPSIGLVTSHYSHTRMTGALGNVGLEQFALPAHPQALPLLLDAVGEVADRGAELRDHLRRVADQRQTEQAAWWDAMVLAMGAGTDVAPVARGDIPTYRSGEWQQRLQDVLPFADQSWRRDVELRRVRAEVAQLRDDTTRLEEKLAASRRELGTARSRPAARLARRLRGLIRSR